MHICCIIRPDNECLFN